MPATPGEVGRTSLKIVPAMETARRVRSSSGSRKRRVLRGRRRRDRFAPVGRGVPNMTILLWATGTRRSPNRASEQLYRIYSPPQRRSDGVGEVSGEVRHAYRLLSPGA